MKECNCIALYISFLNERQPVENNYKLYVSLYSIGLLVITALLYSELLCEFGSGGRALYKGNHIFERFFNENEDYILLNTNKGRNLNRENVRITPISKEYYDLINKCESKDFWICFISMPFLWLGVITYWPKVTSWKEGIFKNWPMNVFSLWLALFLPRKNDPFITVFSKLYYLLMFVHFLLLTNDYYNLCPSCSEENFINRIYVLYIGNIILSLILSFILTRVWSDRGNP